MQWLPAASVIITILVSVIGVTRHISKRDSDVDANARAIAEVNKRVDKVEGKADDNAKEITGPVNIKAATLARDIAYALDGIARVESMLATHISEYRADQHRVKRS